MTVTVYEPCVACKGTGEWDDTRSCPSCGGKGEVAIPVAVGEQIPMKCSVCGKPHPGLDKTASWARSYVCPCGSSQFGTVVTFGG